MSVWWRAAALTLLLAWGAIGGRAKRKFSWRDGTHLPLEGLVAPSVIWAVLGISTPYDGVRLPWLSLAAWGLAMLGAGVFGMGSAVVWGRAVRARRGQRVLPLPHTAVVMAWSGSVGMGLLALSWAGVFLQNQMLRGNPVAYTPPIVWLGILSILAWGWLMFMRRHFRWSRWIGMAVGVWLLLAPLLFSM